MINDNRILLYVTGYSCKCF